MKVKNIKEQMKGLNNKIIKLENEKEKILNEFEHCLDRLLTIAEKYYPKFSSSDNIALFEDIYKKYFDKE